MRYFVRGETNISFLSGNAYLKRAVLFLGVLFLLTHCASVKPQAPKVDEREVLRNRAYEYWQMQVSGKIDQAYQFEAPAYRDQYSLRNYMGRFKLVQYIDASVFDVEMNGEEAKVKVAVTYKLNIGKLSKMDTAKNLDENWVKLNNIWYHIPEGFGLTKN